MAQSSPDPAMERCERGRQWLLAKYAEQEHELLQTLLAKYADHRGVGQDAKWAVILREFNASVPEASQKTEASLKRAAKKIAEQEEQKRAAEERAARYMEEALDRFSRCPAQSPEEEGELLGALLQKYADHRGTGEDAKWTVITREFNARASEASQKSEASLKRAAKRVSEKAAEKPGSGAALTPEKVAKKKEDKPKAEPKAVDDCQATSEASALLRRDGYVLENTSGESLSVRWFSRGTEEYDGPVGVLAEGAKMSLEFLANGELEQLLAVSGIEATDALMVRCFLFMMKMRLKNPDWRFDQKLIGACCDKWAKQDNWTDDDVARQGTVELHVWRPPASAEASPPTAKWVVKACRCEAPADAEGVPGWGAEFGMAAA